LRRQAELSVQIEQIEPLRGGRSVSYSDASGGGVSCGPQAKSGSQRPTHCRCGCPGGRCLALPRRHTGGGRAQQARGLKSAYAAAAALVSLV
jgi:hypothetical protein